mmetsp:Transcript_23040/g.50438  ORF Transcript_23040/g.50438 Transcript_23040/m.50438 type:complete len:220 (-) Transcript_23040:517-1176(-)
MYARPRLITYDTCFDDCYWVRSMVCLSRSMKCPYVSPKRKLQTKAYLRDGCRVPHRYTAVYSTDTTCRVAVTRLTGAADTCLLRSTFPMLWSFWKHDSCVATQDNLSPLIRADGLKMEYAPRWAYAQKRDRRCDRITQHDRPLEIKRLRCINSAGMPFAHNSTKHRSVEHPVNDRCSKSPALRKAFIGVHGIMIISQRGKRLDLGHAKAPGGTVTVTLA